MTFIIQAVRSIGLCVILWMLFQRADVWGQKPSITINSDIRVFTMLAALHQAGLDFGTASMDPVQQQISQEFRNLPVPLAERLRTYYKTHTFGIKPDGIMSRYISLALLCEGPPDFKLSLPLTMMPPDAQSVYEFLDLVKQFYTAGRIESIWSRYQRDYDEAIITYRPLIDRVILTTDGYLRIPSGSFLDRQLTIIPELQAPPNSFNARTYREDYYLVFGPSDHLKSDEIRHQYLHFALDHYALRYTLPREIRQGLSQFTETAPDLQTQYREDQQFLVTESLIRAVELRMNKVPDSQAQGIIDGYVRAGALLTRHFYEILPEFEQSGEGIRVAYPNMLKAVQLDRVRTAFEAAQKAPIPAPPTHPEPSEVEQLLRRADASLGDNEAQKAKELYQAVLKNHDADNGAAWFGLGVISSIENDRQSARDEFKKALQSPSSDKSTKVWAHIYLARLYDVEGDRKEAISEYQAAIDLGDNTRNAQQVAQQGLKAPFSVKKKSVSP
jgi:tetratricopeptide (TPR) repeat protein